MTINTLEIEESHSMIDGGFIYFLGSDINFDFSIISTKITMTSSNNLDLINYPNNGGGFAYIESKSLSLLIDTCEIKDTKSLLSNGGFIYATSDTI